MEFAQLNEEQRRRLVDIRQVFETWRAADSDFRHSYRGSMRWRRVNGKDYLFRISGTVGHSVRPRSAETERMNRAADLGRVPRKQPKARV